MESRRDLPSVGSTLERPRVLQLTRQFPPELVKEAVRALIAGGRVGKSLPTTDAEWSREIEVYLEMRLRSSLRPVINATGVVLHTNLGRAPLAHAAIQRLVGVSEGASSLEYDVASGARGSRHVHCSALLAELTGAEDALVVNNCAAALVLALQTLAAGRESIVSRGELIEIGGSFRVPDIMAASGTTLVEVGTTNRTHVADYRAALSPRTGAIVKVHRSNFSVDGFVAEASVRDLVPIAAEASVPLIFDFGSGLMLDLSPFGLTGEPTAREAVADGATLVVMSGDKLLGGPQAGIILGTRDAIAALRKHPLARALRVDKLTLAALEATLQLYREPERAVREIPTLAMLTTPVATLRARADALIALPVMQDAKIDVRIEDSTATVGGGAFPTARIPSIALSVGGNVEAIEERLRGGALPVIGRIADGRLLLDLRTVAATEDQTLLNILLSAARP